MFRQRASIQKNESFVKFNVNVGCSQNVFIVKPYLRNQSSLTCLVQDYYLENLFISN